MRVKFLLASLIETDIQHYLINWSGRKGRLMVNLRKIGILALALLFAGSALGRDWSSGLDLEYTDGTYVMPYRLYLPANYSETTA